MTARMTLAHNLYYLPALDGWMDVVLVLGKGEIGMGEEEKEVLDVPGA